MTINKDNTIIDRTELIIPSVTSELGKVEKLSQYISHKASFSEEQSDNLAIVLTELVNNAIVHGNKLDADKKVIVKVIFYRDRVQVSVKDEGSSFDPSTLKNPTDPENLWKENGRGIFLVRNLVDDVQFNPSQDGMEIIITEYKENE
ncbi:MAG TPA: ATP-binding protein [Caldithrix sp.]|nr:ATP-binding protein [Caldithrix sp.]